MVGLICKMCKRRTEHIILGDSERVKAVCSVCGKVKNVMRVKTGVVLERAPVLL